MSTPLSPSPLRATLRNWRVRLESGQFKNLRPTLKLAVPVLMLLVGIVAGLLLASNALLNASPGTERQPVDLTGLIRQEQNRLEERNGVAQELRQEVADLREAASAPIDRDPAQVSAVSFAAARTAVAGPGIEVQLWDAPIPVEYPANMQPDQFVVHQQDLEMVINALWTGGAEAITVQGHRLTANTPVRCVGNVLFIGGAMYSPPYQIAAIGDPFELEQAVYASERVQSYLWFVDRIRLGWSLEPMAEIIAPADERSLSFEFSTIPGVDIVDASS